MRAITSPYVEALFASAVHGELSIALQDGMAGATLFSKPCLKRKPCLAMALTILAD